MLYMKKVVLGLSDGVDSAVAGYILKAQGYEVTGVYLDIAGNEAREAAIASARELQIPLKIADVTRELTEHVCKPFIAAYLRGETPNPCPGCNANVKLPLLLREEADCIATGHYVRTDGTHLFMGSADNDQSYMLSRLTGAQAARLLLPLGDKNKAQVRKIALKKGFSCAARPDSRENCFVKGLKYSEWIEQNCPEQVPPPGDVTFENEVIGRHGGIHTLTVGQKWGEMDGRRLYVSKINPLTNGVEVCVWEALFKTELRLTDLHFIYGAAPAQRFEGQIRVRHTRRETPRCTIIIEGAGARVLTQSPVRAPAPGQPAALYIGDMLIGGGTVSP